MADKHQHIGCVMFCPKCKAEYGEGLFECGHCKIVLVPGLPLEPESKTFVEYNNLVNIE